MEETFVYIIQRGFGSIKIGVAKDPESRLAQLQTGNFRRLHLIAKIPQPSRDAAFRLEKMFHQALTPWRLSNGEWFRKSAITGLRSKGILRDEHLKISAKEVVNLGERYYKAVCEEYKNATEEDLLNAIASLKRRNDKLEEFNRQRLAMLEARRVS